MVQKVVGSNPIIHPKVDYVSVGPTGEVPPTTLKVLYPSGLRGESAKLLFSSSNLLGTSTLPCSVIGNTSDFGSEESKFEPWRGNKLTHILFYFYLIY